MFNPVSTYRLQLHKDFTLNDFQQLIPYLKKLGIKTIYASPVFRAVPGSMHGYDGVNPNQVNPEIGTTEQLKEISKLLQENGMSWLQDIVPNHMAFHHHNNWLMDVLENGRDSDYASFFDILWRDEKHKRLMAPFLNSTPEEAIEKEELKLVHEQEKNWLHYAGNYFPLNKKSNTRLNKLHINSQTAIDLANEDHAFLSELVNEQHYELVHWQETDEHINYRRFFTVNGLVCLNIQNQTIFDEVHRLTLELVKCHVFQGLRIDHIDGLYDPSLYLTRLRQATGNSIYILVEKILEPGEALPQLWPVQGTTGYDFLASVNNLFTAQKNEKVFTDFYNALLNTKEQLPDQIHEKKSFILHKHMAGELRNLCDLFIASDLMENADTVSKKDLESAMSALLARCPVYRFYGNKMPLPAKETEQLQTLFSDLTQSFIALIPAIEVLEKALLKKPAHGTNAYNEKALHFYQRCMQFTGPLMAKGVEDTLMYTYNRFIGHNDVGDSPGKFGITTAEFHKQMLERFEKWSLAMNTTSTHDTKRGEDVRARLNVLSDLPAEWFAAVNEWRQLNQPLKENNAPSANDEYFIYQILAGTYPFHDTEHEDFKDRLKEYLPKALREAKTNSTWAAPDEAYESATINFTLQLLNQRHPFLKSFRDFHAKIADHGIINSLAQLVLKFTCPGVPDTYQGTELWDLSLVDPDNRRPVDYTKRRHYMDEPENTGEDAADALMNLWKNRADGRIKLHLLHTLLQLRNTGPKLFEEGFYYPLTAEGKYKEHILAFARHYKNSWCIVIVPLHTAQLNTTKKFPAFDWKDTHIVLPEEAPRDYEDLLLHTKAKTGSTLMLNEIFKVLPIAVLKLQKPENPRGSGVLIAVSSLPSSFGIGDVGPGAMVFVDFLKRSAQKYWQLLPLTPIEACNGYSPYSSVSSMAGNVLLISPELLVKDHLLDDADLEKNSLPGTDKTDYEKASVIKHRLLEKAFTIFKQENDSLLQKEFSEFIESEAHWLNDFTSYCILSKRYNAEPWYKWPETYRDRHTDALETLNKEYAADMEFIKWQQYIFQKQWQQLKRYCMCSDIQIIGDLPFYVSHNSAEVWAEPGVFSLDGNSLISGVAGVPPDYFSKTGQLWGMPTYNWEALKKNNYDWWIKRLRKNLEMFDLLRIDHFRALAEYWEVPAGEATAIKGLWLEGPGEDFFKVLGEEIGKLSFVAEDLGDSMEKVYRLRDAVKLPGMKVLQFAFGENLPTAVDIPHNYKSECIVYTGTHDNNTTVGWYKHETTGEDRKRIEKYTGKKVTEKTISDILAEMAYASVANTAILPMQDILGLDEHTRMNTPGSNDGNWQWRLNSEGLNESIEKKLRGLTVFYNRV